MELRDIMWIFKPRDFDPKYGYCIICNEFFLMETTISVVGHCYCPNKYHNEVFSRVLRPCYSCWDNKKTSKSLLRKCNSCEHRFQCLTGE
jgi:hypothetical protein